MTMVPAADAPTLAPLSSSRSVDAAGLAAVEALRTFVAAAEQAREEASSASGTADGVVMNVRMVSAMIGQLLAGIDEVWTSSSAPLRATRDALSAVRGTSEQVQALTEIGRQIRGIVGVIDSIALTTNVLALNATIEAAHAGEVGKGFAVVASEVKSLARQTTQATVAIAGEIEKLQVAAGTVSGSMVAAERSVVAIHEMVERVTSAVASQKELTDTVKTYMAEAADSVAGIAEGVGRVDAGMSQALESARAALDHGAQPGDLAAAEEGGHQTCPSWNGIPS